VLPAECRVKASERLCLGTGWAVVGGGAAVGEVDFSGAAQWQGFDVGAQVRGQGAIAVLAGITAEKIGLASQDFAFGWSWCSRAIGLIRIGCICWVNLSST
jgi:hypothetical protein